MGSRIFRTRWWLCLQNYKLCYGFLPLLGNVAKSEFASPTELHLRRLIKLRVGVTHLDKNPNTTSSTNWTALALSLMPNPTLPSLHHPSIAYKCCTKEYSHECSGAGSRINTSIFMWLRSKIEVVRSYIGSTVEQHFFFYKGIEISLLGTEHPKRTIFSLDRGIWVPS